METMRDKALWFAGIGMLAAAKVAHKVRGYKTPRPFSNADVVRAATYSERVVSEWRDALQRWSPQEEPFRGARVLELAPGSDFGTGMLLTGMHGAESYAAFDAHPLALGDRGRLYEHLCHIIKRRGGSAIDAEWAYRCATDTSRGGIGFDYRVDSGFDLMEQFGHGQFDLIVSQAAFEHFDNPIKTLADVTGVAAPGARLCIAVDFATHGRWIREADPLNIYRYSDRLYKALAFRGSPNRVPLSAYTEALYRMGWLEVQAITDYAVPDWQRVQRTLHPQYRQADRQHRYAVILARKVE